MTTAIFASAFHPSLGGVEELVRQLAGAHARVGQRALVFTERWPRSLPARETFDGTPVRRFPMRVPDGAFRAHLSYHLTHPMIRAGVVAEVSRHRTEVLHVQCVSSATHYALAAKRALGLPLVVSLQGELTMDAGGLFQRSHFAQRLMRQALDRADVITACSGETLREAEAFYGKEFGDRASVVYNGIRLADFVGARPYGHSRPYILAIGRHVPQKGFDLLLRAYAALLHSGGSDHDLFLAGDGEQRLDLERLTRDLRLEERVTFLGRVDRSEAVRLFSGCSFFVLPSRHEPMGIVNLEAMAAGKAVVAARVGGVPELVDDGRTGILFTGGNENELTSVLQRVTADAELRSRLGKAGQRQSESFDWEAIALQYRNLYIEASKRARGTGA